LKYFPIVIKKVYDKEFTSETVLGKCLQDMVDLSGPWSVDEPTEEIHGLETANLKAHKSEYMSVLHEVVFKVILAYGTAQEEIDGLNRTWPANWKALAFHLADHTTPTLRDSIFTSNVVLTNL